MTGGWVEDNPDCVKELVKEAMIWETTVSIIMT